MIKLKINDIIADLQNDNKDNWRCYIERLKNESSHLRYSVGVLVPVDHCYGNSGLRNDDNLGVNESDSGNDFWKNWKDRDKFFPEFHNLELEFINLFFNKYKYRFCPYCGKIPLIGYENDKGKRKRTFDLDHFYLKNTYRHLMYNFYNLVPVCKICNQLKSTKKFIKKNEYYHPYFGWVKNMKIDDSKNQHTEFCFSENVKFNEAQKLYRLDSIYLNAQDTKNDIKFIRAQLERIADTKKKLSNA